MVYAFGWWSIFKRSTSQVTGASYLGISGLLMCIRELKTSG